MEDNAIKMQRMAYLLGAFGHTVLTAMNGEEGPETIRILRREFPATKIIAISAGGYVGLQELRSIARLLEAQCALHKPFEVRELLAAVREILHQNELYTASYSGCAPRGRDA